MRHFLFIASSLALLTGCLVPAGPQQGYPQQGYQQPPPPQQQQTYPPPQGDQQPYQPPPQQAYQPPPPQPPPQGYQPPPAPPPQPAPPPEQPIYVDVTVAPSGSSVPAIETFYDELSPYGTWYDDPSYGWVFSPSQQNYVPYSDGHWKYTDYGFTWVSNEPFG